MERVPASHALIVYAEPLAAEARVVVVGDATQGFGERLLDLGARTVHVYDPDRLRARELAAEPARGLTIRELPAGDFDVRDGAFDLAIVPDLALVPEPASLLARLRRLVGPDGAALVCAPREGAESLGYYELYDLVSMQFPSVRMIGQVPFVGVAIAELGETDDEADVSVDTQLLEEPPPPDVYIALAGQRDVRLDSYAVIQLPGEAPAPEAEAIDVGAFALLQAQLAEAQLRGQLLQSQLDSETESLEARLSEAEARCVGVRAELEAAREAAAVAVVAVEQRDAFAARAERAHRRAEALEVELGGVSEAHAREIASLEDALRERARVVKALEDELQRRERIARDLVAALEEARAAEPPAPVPAAPSPEGDGALEAENAELRAKLDALALDLARRQGELEATGWRLAELENALAAARADGDKKHEKVAALLDELDVVKQALAQEHAARTLAESKAAAAS